MPEAVKLLDTIPGVGETAAQIIVAEIGGDLERFPTDHHLASWAGMCPGNKESAGKRQSGQTTKGRRYLRAALVQAAWAATHQKRTSLAAQYKRLVKRMGTKQALVAGGHSILGMGYHVLQHRTRSQEWGGDGVAVFKAANGDLLVGVVTWEVDAEVDAFRTSRIHFSWRDFVEFSDGRLCHFRLQPGSVPTPVPVPAS